MSDFFYKLPKNLSDLSHFFDNQMIQFKEETVGGVDVIIPCYMIATPELWQQPFALELRGHVFRKDTGELISAALPKFFNIGENAWTQRADLPWSKGVCAHNKLDGSMLTFAVINDKVYAKTKKSFYSEVAKDAQAFIDRPENERIRETIKDSLRLGISPVYEFFHPNWPVVIEYADEPKLFYLGYREMRDSISEQSGKNWRGYWFPSNTDAIESSFNPWNHDCNFLGSELEKWQNSCVGEEGVVLQFIDGRVAKAKTLWYLQQHRVKTEMRERDIAELAAQEKLDDVKSLVTEAKLDLTKLEAIETRVAEIIAERRHEVQTVMAEVRKAHFPTPKEVALAYKNHPLFGSIMTEFRGGEVDYVDWFLKNRLRDFSLRCVYNENFS